ncbi:MAG TPA: RNA polymerase sigma factor [Casimicrobiaceae bacterium]|nr:RNA polymerase sigma factor [Casimicrobiaceae bacterium]
MLAARPAAEPSADRSDERLMIDYAQGDAAAFDALYARHKGPVYRYLLRQCSSASIADELFQDVWMNLVRARSSYAPAAKFTTWLYTVARHRLVDHWRSVGQIGLVSIDDETTDACEQASAVHGSRVDEPETRVQAREIGRHLMQAVAALPAAQREAFLLQQEAGLSIREIAELTASGEETVKSRLRYATAKLREALEPFA